MKTMIRRQRETGIIVIMAALTMFVLLGCIGLALDASFLYFQKRRMQTAADAGAYGAALEKLRGHDNTAASAAAQNDTGLNGFTNSTDNITVTVNIPPVSGSKAGDSKYIEVIITQPQPTWFMRAVNFNSALVSARAVAGVGNTNNGCVYALNRDTSNVNNGFFANGATTSSFSCGVFSNANFRSTGTGCVSTPTVSYTGTYDNHNGTPGCGPTGVGQGVPIVDPLKDKYTLPTPYGTCDHSSQVKITNNSNESPAGSGVTTLQPGVYCGGISIGGSATNVVFSPGNYILMGGGMSISSSVVVSGTGVTFWNTYPTGEPNKYDAITINGSGVVHLTAPTVATGTLDSAGRALSQGLLFWQDPTVSWSASNGNIIAGGANSVFDGIIYFPTTDLTYAGNSSSSPTGTDGYTLLVGYNIKINGTAQINSDFSSIGGSNPFQDALFAE